MDTLFFVQARGDELGPLTFAQLRSLWQRGEITVQTSFRYENESIWRPVALLQSELDAASMSPPPLPSQQPRKTGATKAGCGCLLLLLGLSVIIWASSRRDGYTALPVSSESRMKDLVPYSTKQVQQGTPTRDADGSKNQREAQIAGEEKHSDKSSNTGSPQSALIQLVKNQLAGKAESFRHVRTTTMDEGNHFRVTTDFQIKNDLGGYDDFTAVGNSSIDGRLAELIEIQSYDTGSYTFEAGTEGVKADLLSVRVKSWKPSDGEEIGMVYLDWKNTGQKPIYSVKALIRAKDKRGKVIEFLGVQKPYPIFSTTKDPIMPGSSYKEPDGEGHALGLSEVLRNSGFKTAEAKIVKVYGKTGIEDSAWDKAAIQAKQTGVHALNIPEVTPDEITARTERFKKWALKEAAVTDVDVNNITLFVTLEPGKYTTAANVSKIAEKIAAAYAQQVGLDFAVCHVLLGKEEYAKGTYQK